MAASLTLLPLQQFPLVEPGDDLAALIQRSLAVSDITLQDNDVIVVAQKVVSKAENRYVYLDTVEPSPRALEYAALTSKEPRRVELVLRESNEVVRYRKDVLIVEHRLGYVHANAGIDHSNLAQGERERLLLLPENPDQSALQLRTALQNNSGASVAVIINDSFGRAWRNGTCGIAIGCAGMTPLADLRGQPDLFGKALEITQVGTADEIAAAASLMMGQAGEATPVVLVRGLTLATPAQECGITPLLRRKDEDLFR